MYYGKYHKGTIVWVNKMESIFESNPPLGEHEKIMMASNNLEAQAYDWFLWWPGKRDTCSFHWNTFMDALLKIFFNEEEDFVFNFFFILRKKGLSVNIPMKGKYWLQDKDDSLMKN